MRKGLLVLLCIVLFSSCMEEDAVAQKESKTDSISLDRQKEDSATSIFLDSNLKAEEMAYQYMYDAQNSETCEHAMARAAQDTAAGKLRIYTFGYPADMCSFELSHSLLNTEYGIEANHLGCVIDGWESCYNEVMSIAIEKKFGADCWNKIHTHVDSVCATRYQLDFIPQIPLVEVSAYSIVYYYQGEENGFCSNASRYFRLTKSMRKDSLRRKVNVVYHVDTTGKVGSWDYILGESGSTEYYDSISPVMRKRLDRAIRRAAKKSDWVISTGKDGKKESLEEKMTIRFDRRGGLKLGREKQF
jgi:hypothetical protein